MGNVSITNASLSFELATLEGKHGRKTNGYQMLPGGAKWLLRVNNSPLLGVKHWHHFESKVLVVGRTLRTFSWASSGDPGRQTC